MDLDQSTPTDVESIKGKLSSVQRKQNIEDTTTAFAFEDTDGHIVKVYVNKEQSENFKTELSNLLDDVEHQNMEIAEVIYRLHQKYDIVNVEWCEGAIPEDEEVADPNAPIENSEDAQAKGFPQDDEPSDVDAAAQGEPGEVSEPADIAADAQTAPEVDVNGEVSKMAMLNKVLGLLQARTDADRAKAEAEKAKSDVEASKVAAQAAAQYASSQEELLDMDNYNKRAQEDKREATLQSKLIRYRHDLRKQSTSTLDDKLKDPDFLLNMLAKAHRAEKIGESMNPVIATPPTPEEEELLHAEDWEKEQSEKQKAEKNRERLLRYRHAAKKRRQAAPANEGAAVEEEEVAVDDAPYTGIADIKNSRFSDYLKANGFKAFADSVARNS